MNNNSLNIVFEDLFKLIVGFIADDLKMQKHFYNLSLSGLDSTPLQLNLHEGIFILVGFGKDEITEEVKQWYFQQTERGFNIYNDEKAFQHLASEILEGLLKFRKEIYSKRIREY
ncbi:MAG: hypothetical protein ACO1N0_01840 [Fluviicola sp.]